MFKTDGPGTIVDGLLSRCGRPYSKDRRTLNNPSSDSSSLNQGSFTFADRPVWFSRPSTIGDFDGVCILMALSWWFCQCQNPPPTQTVSNIRNQYRFSLVHFVLRPFTLKKLKLHSILASIFSKFSIFDKEVK